MVTARYFFRAACAAFILMMASGAQAQSAHPNSAANSLGEKYDTKLPVEISADNLEVLQHENKAIFTGNVIAVQGKIRLKSDKMIVHYKQKADSGSKPARPAPVPGGPPAAPAAADQGNMGAITLIEVEGNVFAATPEESAKGDKGDYQVPEKLLHLTGDNVILTRDKNILRGTELVYNLETGRSVLTNKGAKVGGSNGGRVRGVFVPNDDDKDKEKSKKGGKRTDSDKAASGLPMPSTRTTVTVPAASQ